MDRGDGPKKIEKYGTIGFGGHIEKDVNALFQACLDGDIDEVEDIFDQVAETVTGDCCYQHVEGVVHLKLMEVTRSGKKTHIGKTGKLYVRGVYYDQVGTLYLNGYDYQGDVVGRLDSYQLMYTQDVNRKKFKGNSKTNFKTWGGKIDLTRVWCQSDIFATIQALKELELSTKIVGLICMFTAAYSGRMATGDVALFGRYQGYLTADPSTTDKGLKYGMVIDGGDFQTVKAKYGDSAIEMAALNGHTDVVSTLLDNGAILDQAREPILALLAKHPDNKDFVEAVILELNNVDIPIYAACAGGRPRLVKDLLKANADIDSKASTGDTGLTIAAKRGDMEITNLLVTNGADVHIANRSGMTAFMIALTNNHIEIAMLMIQCGIDINQTDPDDKSVLDYAIEFVNDKNDERLLNATKKKFVFPGAKFLLFKDFLSIKPLSSGNFGIAYKSELIVGKTQKGNVTIHVVCKVPKDKNSDADDWFELQTLQNLPSSPYALALLGICTNFEFQLRNTTAMVIPFKQGGNLRDNLDKRKRPLSFRRLIEFGFDMARGVNHLHENAFKHNDIAVRNFLLSEHEYETGSEELQCLVLSDFGLTRPANHEYKDNKERLLPWRWCAPEVLRSWGAKTSLQSDIWMLGVSFWECLGVKMPPFHYINTPRELLNNINGQNEAPFIYPKGVPNAWRELIQKCCAIRQDSRLSSRQVVAHLADLLKADLQEDTDGMGILKGPGKGNRDELYTAANYKMLERIVSIAEANATEENDEMPSYANVYLLLEDIEEKEEAKESEPDGDVEEPLHQYVYRQPSYLPERDMNRRRSASYQGQPDGRISGRLVALETETKGLRSDLAALSNYMVGQMKRMNSQMSAISKALHADEPVSVQPEDEFVFPSKPVEGGTPSNVGRTKSNSTEDGQTKRAPQPKRSHTTPPNETSPTYDTSDAIGGSLSTSSHVYVDVKSHSKKEKTKSPKDKKFRLFKKKDKKDKNKAKVLR